MEWNWLEWRFAIFLLGAHIVEGSISSSGIIDLSFFLLAHKSIGCYWTFTSINWIFGVSDLLLWCLDTIRITSHIHCSCKVLHRPIKRWRLLSFLGAIELCVTHNCSCSPTLSDDGAVILQITTHLSFGPTNMGKLFGCCMLNALFGQESFRNFVAAGVSWC